MVVNAVTAIVIVITGNTAVGHLRVERRASVRGSGDGSSGACSCTTRHSSGLFRTNANRSYRVCGGDWKRTVE